MNYHQITTWRDLRDALAAMTEAELGQPAQLFPREAGDGPVPLEPLYLIAEIGFVGARETRSVLDGDHHPEHVVLLADANPFEGDGSIGG